MNDCCSLEICLLHECCIFVKNSVYLGSLICIRMSHAPDMKWRSEYISMLWQENGRVCLASRGDGVEHSIRISRL